MSSQTPCFVVNLIRDVKRREAMVETLRQHNIQAEFFPAVDGRTMNDEELESHVDRAKADIEYGPLVRAEIGTALSHIAIYREMVKRNLHYAVVLEDDVCLSEDFSRILNRSSPDALEALYAPDESIVVQLSHVKLAYRSGSRRLGSTGRDVVCPYGGVWLTSGYFITLGAARKLAQGLYPVWAVADYWNRFEEKGLVRLRALSPNSVWESDQAQFSSISPERTNRRKPAKTLRTRVLRLWNELIIKPLLVRRIPRQPS